MSDTRLNTLKAPAKKAARRVGRGIGSNYGKTSGRGHKGQRARAGARRDGVFEGGQMPLHRRVPKRGFSSRLARRTMQLRLSDIERLKVDNVDMEVLREKSVLSNGITRARIFNQGAITRAVVVSGIPVSKGAKQAIEAAGGKIVSN